VKLSPIATRRTATFATPPISVPTDVRTYRSPIPPACRFCPPSAKNGSACQQGRPEEIAELLAFCASDRPGYLTGIDILCDGGTRAGLTLKGMIAMVRGA